LTAFPVLQFIANILTALVFVPYGAHLFELPNKIGLSEHQYFIVQSIYRGWALFSSVIFAAIAANLLAAAVAWRRGRRFWPNLAAGLIMAATLLVFFVWIYPANQETSNWTIVTANWESLRTQWELSHSANAILTFVALCCAALSGVLGKSA
jgi:MFS family permease